MKSENPHSFHFFRSFSHHTKHKEMNHLIHSVPGYMRALMLDMLGRSMSYEELLDALDSIEMHVSGNQKRELSKADFQNDIDLAIRNRLIELREGKYRLTPTGRKVALYMNKVIPSFFNTILSAKAVSIVTIMIHILLSIVKLIFGYFSRSAGLIADGIDNTVDTVSSVLVWIGIRHNKDKLVSIFIIFMMVISFAGIALTGIQKLLNPVPVKEGLVAFIVSAIVGFIMLLLSAYQYISGRKTGNFAILCQSVDSRNHFLTSLLVCGGILISYLASVTHQNWLYYSDAAAACIIGILILKSSFELFVDLLKPENEKMKISHMVDKAGENLKMRIVFEWMSSLLEKHPLSYEELKDKFQQQFCEATPKIYVLTGIGYLPKSSNELRYFIDTFVRKKKIIQIISLKF